MALATTDPRRNRLDRSKGARVTRVLATAALDPASLLVAGSSPVIALVLGSRWLLLLGLIAYVVVVAWKFTRQETWRRALEEENAANRALPDPMRLSDPNLRSLVTAIRAGRSQALRALAELPDDVRGHVAFAPECLRSLERCAVRLVGRADVLGRYLKTVRRETVLGELARLEILSDRAGSDEARLQYQRARAAREQQLHALDELAKAQERLTAGLLRVVAIVEALPSRLVHLGTLSADAREDLFGDVDEHLDRMGGELHTSEQALQGVLGILEADGSTTITPPTC